MSRIRVVTIIEITLAVIFSIGIGLIVGAIDTTAGIGATLLAFSVTGFLFVIAWERGNAG